METLRQFFKHCMLFQSRETTNIIYGIIMWFSFGLFVYAIYSTITLQP
ncbi:MAG: hypothetical protein KIT51_15620 [Cyclobacteriaceae bacterium]|nr:MAG: hypothetical protein KIT51_15620 [Cyclobacteriaceae bacterium]